MLATSASSPSFGAALADLLDPPDTEEQRDHAECAADPALFLERHVTIEEPDGTVIPLHLWDFQRDTIHRLHEDRSILVLKARRLGLSWIVLAYCLWLAIFNQGIRILILCKTGDDAAELLDRVRRMRDRLAADPASAHLIDGLPRPAKYRDAVTTLDIGESTIRALMGTPAAARSETAGMVLLDEFGFQRGAGEIWRAAYPTIEGGGRLAVVSTGNGAHGVGGEFAEQWQRAAGGESEGAALFFPWQCRADRDEEWKRRTLAALGSEDRFAAEYPETPDDAFRSVDSTFVYNLAGIAAAERLGRYYDDLRTAGELAPPAGGEIHLGIDWGIGTTHSLVAWPLPGGGLYVPPGELSIERGEPVELTGMMLATAELLEPPLGEARYDAAGAQQMATFAANSPATVRLYRVDFSRRKMRTIGFLRHLFNRAAEGLDHRIIAISPANRVLLRQLRQLEQDDAGRVVKGDDHGPDALIAAAWPIAAEFPDPGE